MKVLSFLIFAVFLVAGINSSKLVSKWFAESLMKTCKENGEHHGDEKGTEAGECLEEVCILQLFDVMVGEDLAPLNDLSDVMSQMIRDRESEFIPQVRQLTSDCYNKAKVDTTPCKKGRTFMSCFKDGVGKIEKEDDK